MLSSPARSISHESEAHSASGRRPGASARRDARKVLEQILQLRSLMEHELASDRATSHRPDNPGASLEAFIQSNGRQTAPHAPQPRVPSRSPSPSTPPRRPDLPSPAALSLQPQPAPAAPPPDSSAVRQAAASARRSLDTSLASPQASPEHSLMQDPEEDPSPWPAAATPAGRVPGGDVEEGVIRTSSPPEAVSVAPSDFEVSPTMAAGGTTPGGQESEFSFADAMVGPGPAAETPGGEGMSPRRGKSFREAHTSMTPRDHSQAPGPKLLDKIADMQGRIFELERAVTQAQDENASLQADVPAALRAVDETQLEMERLLSLQEDYVAKDVAAAADDFRSLKDSVSVIRQEVLGPLREEVGRLASLPALLAESRARADFLQRALLSAESDKAALAAEGQRLRDRVAGVEAAATSFRESLDEWKGRAMHLQLDLERAGDDHRRQLEDRREEVEVLELRAKRLSEQTAALDGLCCEYASTVEELQDRLEARISSSKEAGRVLTQRGLSDIFTRAVGPEGLQLASAVLGEMAVDIYEKKVRELDQDNLQLKAALNAVTADLAAATTELANERRETGRLRGSYEILLEHSRTENGSVSSLTDEVVKLTRRLEESRSEHIQDRRKLVDVTRKLERREAEIERLRDRLLRVAPEDASYEFDEPAGPPSGLASQEQSPIQPQRAARGQAQAPAGGEPSQPGSQYEARGRPAAQPQPPAAQTPPTAAPSEFRGREAPVSLGRHEPSSSISPLPLSYMGPELLQPESGEIESEDVGLSTSDLD